MQAEFEAAVDDGKPFVFAIGCLIVAWRQMVSQGEGRLLLANYALALGLLLPMALLHFEQGIRAASQEGMAVAAAGGSPYLLSAQNSAVPVLLFLWLLLGSAHLCLAWVLVDWDWPRVVKCGAAIGAMMVTLVLFMGVLLLDMSPLISQIERTGIELAAIVVAAWWHARLFPRATPEQFA